MIRSIKDKETQNVWNREFSRKFQGIRETALITLEFLDGATSLRDLSLPGLRLKTLKGDRMGQYSLRINNQYRVCFRWKSGDAYDVEIVDYH